MCGICGVLSNNIATSERKLFANLLFFSQTRGMDSTGVAVVSKPAQAGTPLLTGVYKSLLPSSQALLTKDNPVRNSLEIKDPVAMFGHCRAATIGALKLQNAHPFEFEHIIGIHNGTIRKLFKNYQKFDTDSEGLYKLINDDGLEAALNEVESVSTAYALAWFDKRDETMNFITNEERPISFTYLFGQNTLAFASEEWMLRGGVEAARITSKMNTHDVLDEGLTEEIFTLTKHHHFKVNPKAPREYEINKIKVERKIVHYHNGASHSYVYRDNRGRHYEGMGYEGWGALEDNIRDTPGQAPDWLLEMDQGSHKSGKGKGKGKGKTGKVLGYKGNFIAVAKLADICRNGCANCNRRISPDEALHWMDRDSLICHDCYESEPWAKEFVDSEVELQTC